MLVNVSYDELAYGVLLNISNVGQMVNVILNANHPFVSEIRGNSELEEVFQKYFKAYALLSFKLRLLY